MSVHVFDITASYSFTFFFRVGYGITLCILFVCLFVCFRYDDCLSNNASDNEPHPLPIFLISAAKLCNWSWHRR